MTQLAQTGTVFDTLRRAAADGSEFWSARELMAVLGYDKWQTFSTAIDRANAACDNSGQDSREHFTAASKTLPQSNQHGNFEREVLDYHLTRYACYLTAVNGDPRKAEIAQAQTYFAVKTHEAEQRAAAPALPDDPILAQLQLLSQVRQAQLVTDQKVAAIEHRLDAAPITSERVGEVHRLGKQLGQVMGNYPTAWRLFKDRFGLASYRDLPNNRYDEAVRFLRVQISAYTGKPLLEGP